jgi:hypothetical protein
MSLLNTNNFLLRILIATLALALSSSGGDGSQEWGLFGISMKLLIDCLVN